MVSVVMSLSPYFVPGIAGATTAEDHIIVLGLALGVDRP